MSASPVSSSGPSSGPSAPYASASLYVGDLAPDVTEALLFEIFNAVGPVASVRVCRDAATRRSLGYAYVNFHRVDDAERALDTLNFKNIRSKPCRIMWSHRDPALRRSGLGNIFVNGLAKSIDNKQLYDTFSVFGNILSTKVAQNLKGESLGYGFVHYESDESAQNAIAKVDGKVIAGQQVIVATFKSKKERTGGNSKQQFTNIFVKNLPAETSKETMDGLFSKFGVITSSMVNTDKADPPRGYGFINFQAPEEATAAVEAMNNFEFQGKPLFVGRAQKKEEREKELRDRFEQLKVERQKKYAGVNLYVKNLSETIDDSRVNMEFSKFGPITSARIMRDETGKSRGFGFVCYVTPEDATKAVTEMNGKMIDGKPLYVALAQRKEVRRAHLESQYAQRSKMGPAGMPGVGAGPGVGMMGQALPYGQQGPHMGYPGHYPPGAVPRQAQVGGYMGYPGQPQLMAQRQQAGVRWNGQPGVTPQMINVRQPGMTGQPTVNYQLMPLNRQPMPGQMANGMNGAQRPRQATGPLGKPMGGRPGAAGVPQGGRPGQHPAGNFKYADNVRNPSMDQHQQQNAQLPISPNEPLTIKALAAAPEEMKKQMIGEKLFPLIQQAQPELAGKITGMLLEMDNGELLHLLESNAALNEKIQEALQVLHAHGGLEHEAQGQEVEAQ